MMGLGTRIQVRNIFANLPVREKFLRNEATEWRYIKNLVEKLALVNWNVGFSLFHNQKSIFSVKPSENFSAAISRLSELFKIPAGAWCELSDKRADMQLMGWLISPDASATTKSDFILAINGRVVTSPEVIRAVKDAYKGLTHGHSDPAGLLFLEIDPSNVDVNAHPSKEKVRLRYSNSVYRFVQQAVHQGFSSYSPDRKIEVNTHSSGSTILNEGWQDTSKQTSQTNENSSGTFSSNAPGSQYRQNIGNASKSPIRLKDSTSFAEASTTGNNQASTHEPPQLFQGQKLSIGRVLGQLNGIFILVETKDGLMVIDMHAAHERIVLEQMMAQYRRAKSIPSQRYIIPVQVRIKDTDAQLWRESMPVLKQAGIEVQVEMNALHVHAMPELFSAEETRNLLDELTEILREGLSSAVATTIDKRIEAIMGNIACKRALKANASLSEQQLNTFIEKFGSTDRVSWCNHGRPSWNMISYAQLEKICRRGE